MKSSLLFVSTLATLAHHAIAASCTTGINYCGYNLIQKACSPVGKVVLAGLDTWGLVMENVLMVGRAKAMAVGKWGKKDEAASGCRSTGGVTLTASRIVMVTIGK
ncbi:unnamed protein product [Fusarium graminearum]|uniref:Hydrophobin n=1 Tax=Gibberella zeae TaxID=5518 RepID=A0A9N8NC86_GIBZA|nr:unnamed protein product [Fusarium graminearum]CAG1965142.1 unnamed protein product [Fusarium graminearum]